VRLQESVSVITDIGAQNWCSVKPPASGPMSPRKQHKPFDERLAKEIGQRVRKVLGDESVTAFTERLGISRQWFHDILSGRVPPSVETLSVMADNLGYSLDWLRTGKGMPNDRWSEKTTLICRVAPEFGARGKIKLVKRKSDLVLVPTSILRGFEADIDYLGVLGGENVDLGPLIGQSDEILVDLKDHQLVNNGLFLAQVQDRLLACRAVKARSVWFLSPTENISPETLIDDHRLLGRIRLVWKKV
jgi:transcriptional regulator with XRE-family HTH domain